MNRSTLRVLLSCAVLSLPVACGNDEADVKVRKELQEAGSATAEYMAKKIEQWKGELSGLDGEIAKWKETLDSKTSDASEESKRKAAETLAALKEKRDALASRLDEASKSSAEAWKDIEAGFDRAWTELGKSFEEAKKKFD